MKINKDYKYCLVGTINGLAEEVRRTRIRIIKGRTDIYRNAEAETKRFIGSEVRHHLLAYAFMKGKPYALLEKKYAEGNKPDADHILEIVHRHIFSFRKPKWTIDMVNAWLKGEEIIFSPRKTLKQIREEWAQNAI